MADAVKVIRGLEFCLKVACTASSGEKCPYIGSECADGCIYEMQSDALKLLKEHGKKKFFVYSDGKITPLPDIVRCKDCVHRGKAEKCVLAAIAAEKDFPLFMLDNHGEWYCADGKREAEEK